MYIYKIHVFFKTKLKLMIGFFTEVGWLTEIPYVRNARRKCMLQLLPQNRLDRTGPVDNRPSTTLSKRRKKMWHVTPDTWQMTHDVWQVTHDIWHLVGVNILSKCQLPSSYGLGVMMFQRFGGKGSLTHLMQWITKVFVGQPRLHQVC